MTRTLLILIIFIAIAANAEEKLIPTHHFTSVDREAMEVAKSQVLGENVVAGFRADFKGN